MAAHESLFSVRPSVVLAVAQGADIALATTWMETLIEDEELFARGYAMPYNVNKCVHHPHFIAFAVFN